MRDADLHDALLRQITFSARGARGRGSAGRRARAVDAAVAAGERPRSLVLLAMSLLIPWNVVGTIWQIFGRTDIGLLGPRSSTRVRLQLHRQRHRCVAYRAGDGHLALDVAGRAALLCGLARNSRRLLPGRADRRRVALRRVPLHRVAQDARRADDRGAAALHGQLHDLHGAVRADRRRSRQFHDVPLAVPDAKSRRAVRPGPGGGVLADLLPDHFAAVLHPVQLDAARRDERRPTRAMARRHIRATRGEVAHRRANGIPGRVPRVLASCRSTGWSTCRSRPTTRSSACSRCGRRRFTSANYAHDLHRRVLVFRIHQLDDLRGDEHRDVGRGGASRSVCVLALPLPWRQARVLLAARRTG